MGHIAILKGASGTGKGTRVAHLLEFFNTKFESYPLYFDDHKGRQKQLGLFFPELNILFVGTYVISNKSGLRSWSSLDYINAATGKTDHTLLILKEYMDCNPEFSFIAEGEPMLISNKYRYAWMSEYFGTKKILFQYFLYNNREEYDERILNRSGKLAGESGWGRNKLYPRDYEKNVNEINNDIAADCVVLYSDSAEDFYLFGVRYMRHFSSPQIDSLLAEYLLYSEKNSPLRSIHAS